MVRCKQPKKLPENNGREGLKRPPPLFLLFFAGNYQRVISVRGRKPGFWRRGECKEQRDPRFILPCTCEKSDAFFITSMAKLSRKLLYPQYRARVPLLD
jgi:hypothetical protein